MGAWTQFQPFLERRQPASLLLGGLGVGLLLLLWIDQY